MLGIGGPPARLGRSQCKWGTSMLQSNMLQNDRTRAVLDSIMPREPAEEGGLCETTIFSDYFHRRARVGGERNLSADHAADLHGASKGPIREFEGSIRSATVLAGRNADGNPATRTATSDTKVGHHCDFGHQPAQAR